MYSRGKTYYVYIMASISRVLYTGMTNSLYHRVKQHKEGENINSFTKRYQVNGWFIMRNTMTCTMPLTAKSKLNDGVARKKWH